MLVVKCKGYFVAFADGAAIFKDRMFSVVIAMTTEPGKDIEISEHPSRKLWVVTQI